MINVIIPITDNKMNFNNIISKLKNSEDVNVYIGACESVYNEIEFLVEDCENIEIIKFQQQSKREEIVNSLQRYVGLGSTIIMRKPITFEEFNQFANCKKDVATCDRNLSKFKNYIFIVWQKILKFLLGIRQYEGDTSVVFLSEDISAVVTESGNLSYASRVNRWRGIEESTIKVKSQPLKNELDKVSLLKNLAIAFSALLMAVIVTTCVCVFTNVTIIIGLLLICLDIICFAIIVLTIVMAILNSIVGAKYVQNAIEALVDNEE